MTANANVRASRYDTWALRTMNDPRAKRWHATRAARRRFVAAHIVMTAAGTASMIAMYGTGRMWWLALLVLALVAWIPLTGFLNSMTRGLLELRTRMLDERQLAERGAAHTLGHRITGWAMAVALVGFFVAHLAGTELDELAVPLAATGFALFVLHRLLPLWIAALRVEDEPEDDEVDEVLSGARA
ncbi:hypothetical protein GCM10009801_29880 [Streptomyces albiaxialis]|uniref:Uncharacterized protein n=1 Tax=Streptomyces albiaxialis TaxID=329523 RepID=A0ABN2VWI3_9ACTN